MRSPKLRLTLLSIIAGATSVFAQPPAPPSGSPSCWPPPCVPIDGGITILMAAGAAYGAKKISDSRKKAQKL